MFGKGLTGEPFATEGDSMSQALPHTTTGSAERWGPLWGSRAADWARSEEMQAPAYEEAIRRVGLSAGDRVLDVGCGAGVFLALCAERGAEPVGIDASEELLELAHARVPNANLHRGDMQFLPFDDDQFDLVTGFTSFFFAADMVAALREAGRVARTGSPVVIQVWGDPDHNDLEAMKVIARPYISGPTRTAPAPFWRPGVLEGMASDAGLNPREVFDVSFSYEYVDEATLGSLLLAPAGLATLVGPEHEDEIRAQIVEAMAPFRGSDGVYRLNNELHHLIAEAP
jgi:SAM-dependent methyltransferase